MREKNGFMFRALKLLPILLMAVIFALAAASCGSKAGSTQTTENSTKLPPGATEETSTSTSSSLETSQSQQVDQGQGTTSTTSESTTTATTSTTTTTEKTAYLSGANFTVISAKRETNNKVVVTSGNREVEGDYLEIGMTIKNVGSELVDLSNFSFRLWNPAIEADQYSDYYGNNKTYGGYVSENTISAALLDYSTLQSVSYKLKQGETVDEIFLFFDLNPQSTAKNEGVTKEGTNLIIYDTDTGEKVEINLAGYTD